MIYWIIGITIGLYELAATFLTFYWIYTDPNIYRFWRTFLYAQLWIIPAIRRIR